MNTKLAGAINKIDAIEFALCEIARIMPVLAIVGDTVSYQALAQTVLIMLREQAHLTRCIKMGIYD